MLIVDDDYELANHYRLVLSAANMLVEVVNEPSQLLETIAQFSPEVLLLDVNMPGIDGNETTRRLRASDGPSADAPVIGFSAGTEAEQVQASYAAGMTDWLAKPLDLAALAAALNTALGGPEVDADGREKA